VPQAKRYQLNDNLSEGATRGRRRARVISSKLIPFKEAPLVTSAFLAVGWVLATVFTSVSGVLGVACGIGVSGVLGVACGIGVASTAVITTNGKVNRVLGGSTLGNWHDNALVVRSSGDGRDPVYTSREAVSDDRREVAILVSGCVETLEESEDTRVCGLRRVKSVNLFNDDVIVSNDLSSIVQLLGCSKVGGVSVGEVASLHSLRIQNNGEIGVGLNVTTVSGELEFAGRHGVDVGDITHRCRVARATLNLQAVCDGLPGTEINEVVGADEGV